MPSHMTALAIAQSAAIALTLMLVLVAARIVDAIERLEDVVELDPVRAE